MSIPLKEIFLILLEWFYNHPSLRYGGYIIFGLVFFIPLSHLLSKYEISLMLISSFRTTLTIETYVSHMCFKLNVKES